MLSPDQIFALVYAYFESCALMFNNYLIIFMIYTLFTYAGETFLKFEVRTYWYDRILVPLILITYLLHSYLLFDGVVIGDFFYNSVSFFNALGHYTNALEITWFVFIIAFLVYWTIRLLIYGVHLRVNNTPDRVIKATKKFNRLDALVVLILIGVFMVQGYSTFQNSEEYRIEKEANEAKAKARLTPADYKKAEDLLKEANALLKGQTLNHHSKDADDKKERNEAQ